MRILLALTAVILVISPFAWRAWNGEKVWFPGMNNVIDSIQSIQGVEDAEVEVDESGPDLSTSRLMAERNMKRIAAFENKDGYLRVGTEEEYQDLVTALSRFRVQDGAQAALDAARGSKQFPLFFSVALSEQVEQEPFPRVIGTATVEGGKTREEAYPLPRAAEWFTIGSNPLVTAGELETPSFRTMREFVEQEIAPIVGSANKEDILNAAREGFESDLKFFGVRSTPGIMSAKIWRTYKGASEEQIPAIRFLPYMERRAVSTHPAHIESRRELAKALDLDPDRLEEEVEILAEKNIRRALISYWPHLSRLKVEEPSATTDVDIRVLSAEDMWREAWSVGSVAVGVQGSIDDLEILILDNLGLYEIVNGQKIYRHDLFPTSFVRLTQESKSGAEEKIISYRMPHELSPREILNAAQLQAAIQRVLDKDPKETHFQYGCVQTREQIMEVFNQYRDGLESPSEAFPCRLGYDYATRSVVMFQKEEGLLSDTGEETVRPLGSYGLKDFSKKTIEKVKKMVAENHEVSILTDAEGYRSLAKEIIKSKNLHSVKLDGDKVMGGYARLDVFKERVDIDVVPE